VKATLVEIEFGLPMLVVLWLSISLPIPSQIVLAVGIAVRLVHLSNFFSFSLLFSFHSHSLFIKFPTDID
jgi:hypothetical protein